MPIFRSDRVPRPFAMPIRINSRRPRGRAPGRALLEIFFSMYVGMNVVSASSRL